MPKPLDLTSAEQADLDALRNLLDAAAVANTWSSAAVLAHRLGWTRKKVYRRIGLLRDWYRSYDHPLPLVSGPFGYVFTEQSAANEVFQGRRVQEVRTSLLRTLKSNVEPYIQRLPEDEQEKKRRDIHRHFSWALVLLEELKIT